MVLEGTDCSFGFVSPMHMWRYKLVGAVVFCYLPEEYRACFVVEYVLAWRFMLVGEACVKVVVRLNAMAVMLGPEGLDKNGIALRVECYHYVLVAASRRGSEPSCVVCKELVGGYDVNVDFRVRWLYFWRRGDSWGACCGLR